MLAELYARNSLPRNAVPKLVFIFQNYYNTALKDLKQYITQYSPDTNKINLAIDIIQDSFDKLNTEHKTFKHFEARGALIKPLGVTMRTHLRIQRIQARKTYKIASTKIQTVPMKCTLKQFLELPNVFQTIIDYMNEKEKDHGPITLSMLPGSVWKNLKLQRPGDILLPLDMYADDYPLGSHKCKNRMTGVYFMMSCLPPQYSVQLDNIFLAQIHKQEHYSRLGESANKLIYDNLKKELRQLQQEGISIRVNEKKYQVYFQVARFFGDNLGLNQILGFNGSFNATYYCRISEQIKSHVILKLKRLNHNCAREKTMQKM